LIGILQKLDSFKNKNYEQCLKDLYVKIDKTLQTDPAAKAKLKTYRKDSGSMYMNASDDIAMGAGCTAVSAIVTADKIYIGNAGDSRAIVGLKEGS
jgi:protein phosphatase 2C family protein 2/3